MSFDIYGFAGEQAADLPNRKQFASAFAPNVADDDGVQLHVVYGDLMTACYVSYTLEDALVRSFAVERPLALEPFFVSIYRLLGDFHFFMLWPGNEGPVIGRDGTMLLDGIAESFGPPVFVRSGFEIQERIRTS